MISFHQYNRFDRFIIDNNEKILGSHIKNTSIFPYYLVGQIITPHISGTGTLISPQHILTCAHLIYNCDPTKIIFHPGINGQNKIRKSSRGKKMIISKQFNINELRPNQNDWAIIELDYFYKDIKVFLTLKLTKNIDLVQKLKLIGYPGNKYGDMYESSGPPFELFEKVVSYKINTSTGQSGSPLIMKINEKETIIGLHQSSDILIKEFNGRKLEEYTNKNWGTRISSEIIDLFEKISSGFMNEKIVLNVYKNSILSKSDEGLRYDRFIISKCNEKEQNLEINNKIEKSNIKLEEKMAINNNDYKNKINFHIINIQEKKWNFEGMVDKNGKKQGYGILKMENGDIYKGEFKDDKYEGMEYIIQEMVIFFMVISKMGYCMAKECFIRKEIKKAKLNYMKREIESNNDEVWFPVIIANEDKKTT